jgi:transposase
MPRKRVSMRKIREVLRLKWALGIDERQIAQSCRISRSTIWEYIRRAKEAGLSWPLPADLDDAALEAMLFQGNLSRGVKRPEPDWPSIHQERKRKGVTLLLLWQEYLAQNPEGYGYVTFTIKYRQWRGGLDATMRQDHKAGEKLFIDYAGMTLPITDPRSGEVCAAQVFVATLGASNYTYAEATLSQSLEDWLGSQRRALEYFGGVPEMIVPDNLKAGVKSPCYFEPEINRAYAEFAAHYGVAILPTRVRKPRDKAKVESGVQIVERWILAPLRHRTFFSLQEANEAIWERLEELNHKPFQKLPGSRKSSFEEVDKPCLRSLPAEAYILASWKKAKVNIDYHVEVEGHYYSVPHPLIREQVELRLTQNTLEVFHEGKRVASHRRLPDLPRYRGRHSTIREHMPSAHRHYAEWTPERMIQWAQKNGCHTAKVVAEILASRPHPEQGFRSCLGLMRLGKTYGPARLEAACKRACHFRAFSFKSVRSILQHKLDSKPLPLPETDNTATQQTHCNVRGASYYGKN